MNLLKLLPNTLRKRYTHAVEEDRQRSSSIGCFGGAAKFFLARVPTTAPSWIGALLAAPITLAPAEDLGLASHTGHKERSGCFLQNTIWRYCEMKFFIDVDRMDRMLQIQYRFPGFHLNWVFHRILTSCHSSLALRNNGANAQKMIHSDQKDLYRPSTNWPSQTLNFIEHIIKA
jgi:enoyl-CoA hydratase/carnithine racemase